MRRGGLHYDRKHPGPTSLLPRDVQEQLQRESDGERHPMKQHRTFGWAGSERNRKRIHLFMQAREQTDKWLIEYLRDPRVKRESYLLLSRVACLQALIVRDGCGHLTYPARRRKLRAALGI